ncbi:MAG: hypothetical protein RLZ35_392 [Pseudomonadota bacterium]|jgi:hypothetical protein
MSNNKTPRPQKPNVLETLLSVLGAFFGVQSQKARERDFEHGHPWWVYVGIGVLIALLFIGSLVWLVQIILR